MIAAIAIRTGIRAYQFTLRPVLGPNCRFVPSCSDYALEAVLVHGALAGTALSARRLLRCNPWCAGGHDPVPPASVPSIEKSPAVP